MGNSSSAISPRVSSNSNNSKGVDLEELVRITHYEMHELNQMYNQWKRETPNGDIHKRDFKEFLTNIGIEDPVIHDLIFNAFLDKKKEHNEPSPKPEEVKPGKEHSKKSDKGNKGTVEEAENCLSFKELMIGLSTISRGTEEEKLNFTFNMYDLDNDGFVTRQEVSVIMTALNKLTGNLTTHSEKVYYSVDQAVEDFMSLMVLDSQGRITREAYKNGAKKNKDIFEALKLFTTGLCVDPLKK